MKIKKTGNEFSIVSDNDCETNYIVKTGENGKNFVERKSVETFYLNVSDGNGKTGKALNLNLPIEYTCNHDCECYKKSKCYAEHGCYLFHNNQKLYSENLNFFYNSTSEEFCKAVKIAIDFFGYSLFRYFTCGDIPNTRFFDCMVQIAKDNPNIRFWAYTKKYGIVNRWIDQNGDFPENLTIIFSHWLNENGTYYHMENPHNLPTSEFIPFGKENTIDKSFHVCPCSDPTVKSTCETCEKPCYKLQKGEHMALLEHSTKETKARDKAIKEAKKAL